MSAGDTLLVFRKEMIDLLRDRRSVLAMIVFPVLIHPILIFGSARLSSYGENRLKEETVTAVVEGGLPDLRERIVSSPGVRPLRARDPGEAVRSGRADVGVRLPEDLAITAGGEPEAVLFYDASSGLSGEARERVARIVDEWKTEVREARLDSLGAAELKRVLPVEEKNVASEERMAGGKLGKLLPILIVFLLLNGASFAAVDLFAGERERKTIETLLTSLAPRSSIVAGKFLAVAVSAVIATLLFLASSFFFTRVRWAGGEGLHDAWSVSPLSAAVVFAISLPLAFLLSAVLVLISSHARTYREAQTLLLPSLLLGVVPAAASVAPGVRLESIVAIVPIANVAVAVREALLGNYPVLFLGLVVLSNSIGAYAVLRWARAFLSSERTVYGEARREQGVLPADRPRAREATVFFAFEILVLYYLGSFVQSRDLLSGVILTLWGFLLLPTLVFARWVRLDFRRDFSLRLPSPRHLLAGVLLAPASLLAANLLFHAQSRFLPVPEEMMETFERLLDSGEGGLVFVLFAVAVSPGICEEMLFRGLLLGQYRRVLSPARAILAGGLLFGLFHLSIYRFLPTALLGIIAGWLVLRTRSIVPAMILHAVYNGIGIWAGGAGGALEGEILSAPLVAGVVLLAAGALLLLREREWGGGDG